MDLIKVLFRFQHFDFIIGKLLLEIQSLIRIFVDRLLTWALLIIGFVGTAYLRVYFNCSVYHEHAFEGLIEIFYENLIISVCIRGMLFLYWNFLVNNNSVWHFIENYSLLWEQIWDFVVKQKLLPCSPFIKVINHWDQNLNLSKAPNVSFKHYRLKLIIYWKVIDYWNTVNGHQKKWANRLNIRNQKVACT